ncbi:MAG: Rieske 2Fe-2S domain-containing protein [Calditrichia bacterium]
MDKRSFIKKFLGISVAGTLASIIYPVSRYLIPPKREESEAQSVIAGKVDDFLPNSGQIIKFGNKPALLVRTERGEFRAFIAICTHLDCTVQFRDNKQDIWCACHNGIYDLYGKNVSGPPPKPLTPLVVNVRGDKVVVSRT